VLCDVWRKRQMDIFQLADWPVLDYLRRSLLQTPAYQCGVHDDFRQRTLAPEGLSGVGAEPEFATKAPMQVVISTQARIALGVSATGGA
jgi:hypothetical protein